VSRHILHFFEIIFEQKHFSIKCASRSLLLTFLFCSASLFALLLKRHEAVDLMLSTYIPQLRYHDKITGIILLTLCLIVFMFMLTVPVDYISLLKSRMLLSRVSASRKISGIIFFTMIDLCLSLVILYIYGTVLALLAGTMSPQNIWKNTVDYPLDILRAYSIFWSSSSRPQDALGVIYITSTILTSIWTFSVFCAAMFLRLIIPMKYPVGVLTWLFDVDEHPIKILGIMIAIFAWIGSLAYGLV
jgi:hypothetical protein